MGKPATQAAMLTAEIDAGSTKMAIGARAAFSHSLPQPLVSFVFGVLVSKFGKLSTARNPFGNETRERAFGVDDDPFVASPNSCWLAIARTSAQ
jgi:hypothetical protein